MTDDRATKDKTEKEDTPESPELNFVPVVKLAPVEVKNMEENEDEVFKMRAKLFRFDTKEDPPEWKDRGVGDVRILKHKQTGIHRIIMRRDKTHKICANHRLTADLKLLPSAGSDRAWVWNPQADYADEEAKPEQLAIRFANAENAMKFKEAFEKCQAESAKKGDDKTSDTLADQVTKMTIKDDTTTQETTSSQNGNNQSKDDNNAKKPAAAADDKSSTEDSDKAETNI